jgi:lipoic acid synthetase
MTASRRSPLRLSAPLLGLLLAAGPALGAPLAYEDALKLALERNPALLGEVFGAAPSVLAHNLETVPRIFKRIRPAFRYDRSLDVITQARDAGLVTKSNLILGLGETDEEVDEALVDLHAAGCDLITITQYLRPSSRHHPVERWVPPDDFVVWADRARAIGFVGVMSGPLVRSSYRAGRLYADAVAARRVRQAAPVGLAREANHSS